MKPRFETKILEGRGIGHGANYIPWIKASEFNSRGTTTLLKDWKHGRQIELLSQGELWEYVMLRWDDQVKDIREQYPMNPDVIKEEAERLGYRPTGGGKYVTTDFLVDYLDGHQVAYTVKDSRNVLELTGDNRKDTKARRTMQKIEIERSYWRRFGIECKLVFKEDLNRQTVNNILDAVWWYDPKEVVDDVSAVKCLIAHKHIHVDMEKNIDYRKLVEELRRNGNGKMLDGFVAGKTLHP